MKIEIGGGIHPRGEGFVNVDQIDAAEIVCNLDQYPWPIDDDVADALYSSHCLEHLQDKIAALAEIARICKVGAEVTIRVPHPSSELAMVHGHIGVLGEVDFRNMLEHFPDEAWAHPRKTLRMVSVEQRADPTWFHRAKACHLFADWTDDEILTWLPRTAHENEFRMEVVAR